MINEAVKIKEISIRGMFDHMDYDIPVNERLTIITGPNGYGKTTIINALNNFIDYGTCSTNIYSMSVDFYNHPKVSLYRGQTISGCIGAGVFSLGHGCTKHTTPLILEVLEKFGVSASSVHGRIHIHPCPGVNVLPSETSCGVVRLFDIFSNLLRHTMPGGLFLLDDAGDHLHVTWQKKLLDVIMDMAGRFDIQVIVTTHHPGVINNRWDLVVDLWGLEQKLLGTVTEA